jgi:hypothetical protein
MSNMVRSVLRELAEFEERVFSLMKRKIKIHSEDGYRGLLSLQWDFKNNRYGREYSLHVSFDVRNDPCVGFAKYEVDQEDLPSFKKALERQLEGKDFPRLGIRDFSGHYEDLDSFIKTLNEPTLREMLYFVSEGIGED